MPDVRRPHRGSIPERAEKGGSIAGLQGWARVVWRRPQGGAKMAEPNDQTDDQAVSRGEHGGDAPDLARAEEAAEREAAQMTAAPESDTAPSEPAPEPPK